jgi:opacity protein-like surface antigen
MKTKRILTAILAMATVVSVHAEDVTKQEWHFSPYFWLPSMDVTSKIGLLPPVDLNLGFDEIWDTFDVFALSARGEYWWGKYGIVADGLWMDMETDSVGGLINDVQISDGVLDFLAAYRFNLKEGGADVPSMRLMAGGRYHYLKQEASVFGQNHGGSKDWFEPVLGAQLLAPMGQKWLATARGDVGGFGVADASDITWSAMAGVGYEFARNWMAKLGYRYYYIDYSDGTGTDALGIEGNMHGPWIGIAYGR